MNKRTQEIQLFERTWRENLGKAEGQGGVPLLAALLQTIIDYGNQEGQQDSILDRRRVLRIARLSWSTAARLLWDGTFDEWVGMVAFTLSAFEGEEMPDGTFHPKTWRLDSDTQQLAEPVYRDYPRRPEPALKLIH